MIAFSDLRTAAYCPRQLWYARDDDRDAPAAVADRRALAHRYPDLLDAPLGDEPIAVAPETYRRRLRAARDRHDRWADLIDPADRSRLVTGRECRGIVHKVLCDPPAPAIVSTGEPPDDGVWQPDRVWATAAAKALAWETETAVERAYVEYPAHGRIRAVAIDGRSKAAYRRTVRTVESMDGPPPRLRRGERSKCSACEYVETCGVRTRTLRSLL
ncbi:hypothetical protein BRD17_08760 [Halobacteriales archaeon SW_7_68_16]|nr:MAG: hypothetical protein BRD17_08760 [Halobacteriales archaeon SW_7_68_16]